MVILRSIGGLFAAMAVALFLLVGVELVSAIVHPVPEGFDGSQEQLCAHVANYPAWVLAVVVPLWGATALVSTWIAGRLGNLASALVVGVLLVAAVGFNVSMLPYPLWFKVACLVMIPAACLAGGYWARQSVAVARP
jgi:hypothetical protein